MSLQPHLQPPQSKGHVSVAEIRDHWYVACLSRELKRKPLPRTILGLPMVLFRNTSGEVGALLDRCPHRNVPLSAGEVAGTNLRCGYHGWEFDTSGTCRKVPGLCGDPEHKGRRVEAFPTLERDGLIWVYPIAGAKPDTQPLELPLSLDKTYTTVHSEMRANATVHAVIENALDVPHTAFLHKGLFRGTGEPNDIRVVVRRWHDRVEAEYLDEPRPDGIVGRILSPSGGIVTHYDRFILPSIAQVEYRIGEENHVLVTSLCTPVTDFDTRLFAVTSIKLRLPVALMKPILEPLGKWIFSQDARILTLQTDTIHRFGGEQFTSTEIDVLGPQIWRLLRQAERGITPEPDADPVIKELTMRV